MTSPVDTSVKYFNSAMINAPVLSGTAGSLIALLDACLKDGFDTKTLTSLVAASGVMTATFAGTHSALIDSVVLIAGVTGGPAGFAGANGEQKVTGVPGATTRTWATTLPDGVYTGTITMKMAPLGFTKPFSGTNLAAYKSSDPASSGFYLRVDDTGTTSARVVGYESMSDINTGAGPFPTAAQSAGGGYWAKSVNANSTPVVWAVHGDARLFYITIQAGYSSGSNFQIAATRCFGDPTAYKPGGDPYACVLNYSSASGVVSQSIGGVGTGQDNAVSACPRDYHGLGAGTVASIFSFSSAGGGTYSGITDSMGIFPSVVDGGLWLAETYLAVAGVFVPRAKMPGFYRSPQSGVWNTFKMNDRTPGSGLVAGRNLMAVTTGTTTYSTSSGATNTGIAFLDVTGPWR